LKLKEAVEIVYSAAQGNAKLAEQITVLQQNLNKQNQELANFLSLNTST